MAATIQRDPTIDMHHINNCNGSLAPICLLLRVLPVCLSLYNANFQGLSSHEGGDERSLLSIKHQQGTLYRIYLVWKHVQFLHAGVSNKDSKCSQACYPMLWTLKAQVC
jgi:alpha-1,3-glucan synthase